MNAKDVLIDFLNYAFLIVVVIFFITFFIVGDRFETFTAILKSLVPLAIFSIFFIFFFKHKRKLKKKNNINNDNNSDTNEIVVYVTVKEKRKDIAAVLLVAVVNAALPIAMGKFLRDDLIQVFFIFIAMTLWHLFLLRNDGNNNSIGLTLNKIINDEIIIFLFPIIFYTLSYTTGKTPDTVDIFQSLILLSMYPWHYKLFKKITLTI
ncbi:hypothetical protein L6270_03725 [Candidatus Parcubacteria bacterium]|nr:hypothetical protein [Patescibacteria group bacterium]MBU4309072.1 hypothetical protein [Patescibacteria group bacterium]MBU4432450.1 hypothetical protein [Patescibacteria group bacterium]MBU4577433.1 hypothetical protein [Patescibacteria group bacterium]MCG2697121.1 hypothetical protein [Candidatus Parcubacteria bacterium]